MTPTESTKVQHVHGCRPRQNHASVLPCTAHTHLAKCSESAPAVTIATQPPAPPLSLSLSGLGSVSGSGSVGLVHKPRVFQVSPFSEVSTKRLFFVRDRQRPASRPGKGGVYIHETVNTEESACACACTNNVFICRESHTHRTNAKRSYSTRSGVPCFVSLKRAASGQ